MPTRREQRGDDHEREERRRELDALVRARLDLLPDDGVSRGAPRVLDARLGVLGDLRVDLVERDRAVLGMPSSRRSEITTLASSRATSARIRSPTGLRAAPSSRTTLQTDSRAPRAARARCRSCRRATTIRRWIMGRAGYPCKTRCSFGAEFPRARAKSGRSARVVRPIRSVRPHPYLHEHMFPALTTRRPNKRSLSELVRGAVGTALEFATLGEATLDPVHRADPAPRPAPRAARGGRPPPPPHTRTADGHPSANPAPRRNGPPARTGLPHAGTSPGAQADLAAAGARSGRTGAPDGLAPSPGRRTSQPLGPPQLGRPECVVGRPRRRRAAASARRLRRGSELRVERAARRAAGTAASRVGSRRRLDRGAAATSRRERARLGTAH